MEFPHLQELYKKLQNQGFQIVAINQGDSADVINGYIKEGGFTFPIVMNNKGSGDVAKQYGVMAYPTNYLLDSEGKIVAQFVGFNEQELLDAVKKLGFEL